MKLSEVQVAHELVAHRRTLVKAFVDVGGAKQAVLSHWPGIFGYALDDEMTEVLRKAVRCEIRRRIAQTDDKLAALGVEVDGIEIVIKAEEDERAAAAAAKEAARKATSEEIASEERDAEELAAVHGSDD